MPTILFASLLYPQTHFRARALSSSSAHHACSANLGVACVTFESLNVVRLLIFFPHILRSSPPQGIVVGGRYHFTALAGGKNLAVTPNGKVWAGGQRGDHAYVSLTSLLHFFSVGSIHAAS